MLKNYFNCRQINLITKQADLMCIMLSIIKNRFLMTFTSVGLKKPSCEICKPLYISYTLKAALRVVVIEIKKNS